MTETIRIANRDELILGLLMEKKEVSYSVGAKVSYLRLFDGVRQSDRIKRIHPRLALARLESDLVMPLEVLSVE